MTVQVPPGGTRGVAFPRLLGRMSGFVAWLFRRGFGHRVAGLPTLILETRGARTGRRRQAVLGFLDEPPEAWLVIASMGAATYNPGWLHNLAHDPDATIELPGSRRVAVRAETLAGPEFAAAWERLAAASRQYADYRTKTDREIAMVRLRHRPAA